MTEIISAIQNLGKALKTADIRSPFAFRVFLSRLQQDPQRALRNVFQLFHDMVEYYVPPGVNEYPDDPETINYIRYDCSDLFVHGVDNPFFADRLLANRLINHAHALESGVQQNQIYVFEGPPGAGKSTFLNNLLQKLEEYTALDDGAMYETVWRLDVERLGGFPKIMPVLEENDAWDGGAAPAADIFPDRYLFVPCPSHDHPIVQVPKHHRLEFLEQIIDDREFLHRLVHAKEFEWVLKDEPCTVCRSLYQTLVDRLGSPQAGLEMLFAKRYLYNRRLGEGVSVFSPGDPLNKKPITNPMLQNLLNALFRDSNAVRYVSSRLARTNNGVFAIMDLKGYNTERVLNLHGIISDEVHKVEDFEEYISSLFIALMNPEDKRVLIEQKSFRDRMVRVPIPYILDYKTEVEIYRDKVGHHIDRRFLPMVLNNFARVIVSSRLLRSSDALRSWIKKPAKYTDVCDPDLLLIKMDVYTGLIPYWLDEEDEQRFDAKARRALIAEGETEGFSGFSGRQSVQLFNTFFSRFSEDDRVITMESVIQFFRSQKKEFRELIPEHFLDGVARHYDYTVLQQVKESMYDYNRSQVGRDVKNYLSALTYDPGTTFTCRYTGDQILCTEEYLKNIELRFLGKSIEPDERLAFRTRILKEYISRTLSREIVTDGKDIEQTTLFATLYNRYAHRLKEHALDPFIDNQTFRLAVKAVGTTEYQSYDHRTRQDVELLINNLVIRFGYTEAGAQRACLHVLDNRLFDTFGAT